MYFNLGLYLSFPFNLMKRFYHFLLQAKSNLWALKEAISIFIQFRISVYSVSSTLYTVNVLVQDFYHVISSGVNLSVVSSLLQITLVLWNGLWVMGIVVKYSGLAHGELQMNYNIGVWGGGVIYIQCSAVVIFINLAQGFYKVQCSDYIYTLYTVVQTLSNCNP